MISFAGLTANPVIGLVYAASSLVTMWLVVEGIVGRAQNAGDTSTASTFNTLRWVLVIGTPLGLLVYYLATPAGGLVLIIVILQLVMVAALIVKLYTSARLPYLAGPQPSPGEIPT